MSWPLIAAVAVATCAVTWPLVYGARQFAIRAGIVDHPNARSSHHQPVPRGGGLAIALSTLIMTGLVGWRYADVLPEYWPAVAAGALLVAAISALDDWRGLPVAPRLVVQTIAAIVAWRAVSAATSADGAGWPIGIGLLATVWIVGMINAYNFMDGIDGIAGSTAVIAGLTWGFLGLATGLPELAVSGAAVAGACAAFLIFNWSPASIFMGDVGSAFLGYWFGVMALIGFAHDRLLFLQGVLALWPFIFDTVTTMIRRVMRGENPVTAHRSHLYQRLIAAGWGHAQVALLYALLALTGAVAATLIGWRPQWSVVWLSLPAVCAAALWAVVLQREHESEPARRSAR